MKKIDIFKKFSWLKSPKHVVNMLLVGLFALIFTGVLVSKYMFFQTIVGSDNNSKVTVIAPKNIEVVDTIKTEIRKREFAQKVKTVYAPADSVYIKNNLNEIIASIEQIRASELSYKDKERDLSTMFDISDNNSKEYIISYFINASDESINKIIVTAEKALSSVLNEGITEKDFEENSLPKIIRRNVDTNTTNNQMKMFITRLGFNSKMIITGDLSQIDLQRGLTSGLLEASKILTGIKGIEHLHFSKFDVMRHPLVSKVIERYEEVENDSL